MYNTVAHAEKQRYHQPFEQAFFGRIEGPGPSMDGMLCLPQHMPRSQRAFCLFLRSEPHKRNLPSHCAGPKDEKETEKENRIKARNKNRQFLNEICHPPKIPSNVVGSYPKLYQAVITWNFHMQNPP
jgi:hypothetical protein